MKVNRVKGHSTVPEQKSEGLSVRAFFAPAVRVWWWVALPAILLLALVLRLDQTTPLQYRASATVLLTEPTAEASLQGRDTDASRRFRELEAEVDLAESDTVRARVRVEMNLSLDPDLPDGEVTTKEETDVLIFSVNAATPDEATDIATEWATQYVAFRKERVRNSIDLLITETEASIEDLREQRSATRRSAEILESRLAAAADDEARARLQEQLDIENGRVVEQLASVDGLLAAYSGAIVDLELQRDLADSGDAFLLRRATPPSSPTKLPLPFSLALAGFVGIFTGVGLALAIAGLDPKIVGRSELENMGLTVLGTIPYASRQVRKKELSVVGLTTPDSPESDAYQRLRTALDYVLAEDDLKSIAVVSPGYETGKTTVALNLALAYVTAGIDATMADFHHRRPRLHEILNIDRHPGVGDLTDLTSALDPMKLEHPLLSSYDGALLVRPAGGEPYDTGKLLSSAAMVDLLAQMKREAGIAIIDSSPVLAGADASIVAGLVDGVLLTVRGGVTLKDELADTLANIERTGGRLLGIAVIEGPRKYLPLIWRFQSTASSSERTGFRRQTGSADASESEHLVLP